MDELEQRLRSTLRAVDDLEVSQLDPTTLAARASVRKPRRRLWAWFVAGAAAVAIGASGAVAISTARPSATVTVQLGDGTAPVVTLDQQLGTELFLMVDDQLAAGEGQAAAPPATGSGFGGFLVEASDPARPRLLVFPLEVYVGGASGWQRLADSSETFYTRIWDAVTSHLTEQQRDQLPATSPAIPRTDATVPPQVGVAAVWKLADSGTVAPTSTTLKLKVTRAACAAGRTGKLLAPVVSVGATDVVIRVDAAPLGQHGATTCPYNDWVSVTVELGQPLGNRTLLDAACLTGDAARTQDCAAGAIRWRP